jgi:hypothetical protein
VPKASSSQTASSAKRCLVAAGYFLAANLNRKPAVCARLSRLTLDHIRFFRFGLIISIRSPGQAALREISDKFERETRFLICPWAFLAGLLVRLRSAVETGLSSVTDVVSRGAGCGVRKDRPPGSIRLKRKAAAWDDAYLASLVAEWSLHPILLAGKTG